MYFIIHSFSIIISRFVKYFNSKYMIMQAILIYSIFAIDLQTNLKILITNLVISFVGILTIAIAKMMISLNCFYGSHYLELS